MSDVTENGERVAAYGDGRWCGECRYGVVESPPCCTRPLTDAEALQRVLALADEFDAQVPWPHSWIGNRIREAAGVEK